MPEQINDCSSDRGAVTRRRLWWGITAVAVFVLAVAGAIFFEAVTGRFSGTVMQVRIDECVPRKLRMTAFRVSGSTIELQNDNAAEDSIEVRLPEATAPLLAVIRERFWEKRSGPSHAFATFDKPGSVVYYVKTGDVFQLRPGEKVTLMTWESGHSTVRWAITSHVEP